MKELVSQFRRRKWAYAIGFGAFAALLILAGYLLFGPGKGAESPTLKIMPDNVDFQVKDVHFTEVGDPDASWDIRADSARYMKKESLAVFEKVRITMIRRDGRKFTMSGDSGRVNTDTKDAEVYGNVVLTSDRGDRITTDRVFYSGKEKRAYTEDEVVLTRPGLDLKGKGMVFYVDRQHVRLLSGVKALVKR
jgi:LPS export ABC transporter protein LptC